MRSSFLPLLVSSGLGLLSAFLGGCGGSASPASPATPAPPFAGQQPSPSEVAVLADQVYWATFDGPMYMRACAVSGCGSAPTSLASGPWTINRFAVDEANLYFAAEDDSTPGGGPVTIGRCPRSGCTGAPATIVDAGEISPSGVGAFSLVTALTVDAKNVYWATADGVRECPLGGCGGNVVTLDSITPPGGPVLSPPTIVVDAERVYWSDPNAKTVLACAIGGCNGTPTVLATDQLVFGMALDGTQLSWITADTGAPYASDGTVKTCDVASCGTTLRTLATGEASPVSIAAQGGIVYWADQGTTGDGSIRRCASQGCGGAPATLGGSRTPQWLAVGSGRVFWSDNIDGAIYSASTGD